VEAEVNEDMPPTLVAARQTILAVLRESTDRAYLRQRVTDLTNLLEIERMRNAAMTHTDTQVVSLRGENERLQHRLSRMRDLLSDAEARERAAQRTVDRVSTFVQNAWFTEMRITPEDLRDVIKGQDYHTRRSDYGDDSYESIP
jgi:hypothetical protein